jgi:2-polyprenyl-6-methoxyphenol hydroxylase-like FAD-dependent oxidoreductase
LHVLIIGGGTGGMCLAQGLRRAGVPVSVFERDRTRSDGLHGYRVGINPTGNHALRECLQPELFGEQPCPGHDRVRSATCSARRSAANALTYRLRADLASPAAL